MKVVKRLWTVVELCVQVLFIYLNITGLVGVHTCTHTPYTVHKFVLIKFKRNHELFIYFLPSYFIVKIVIPHQYLDLEDGNRNYLRIFLFKCWYTYF